MSNAWSKRNPPDLKEASFAKREWLIDLDVIFRETGVEFTPKDLLTDPFVFRHIRVKQTHDRSGYVPDLDVGDIVRVVREEAADPADCFDIDLQVAAGLPGGLIMRLRGVDTPWDALQAAQDKAADDRREAMRKAAAAASGEML